MAEFQDEMDRLVRHRDNLVLLLETGTFQNGEAIDRAFAEHALQLAHQLISEGEPLDYFQDYVRLATSTYDFSRSPGGLVRVPVTHR